VEEEGGEGIVAWFKIDDGFHCHPKTQALFDGPCPGDAIALWAVCGSWSGNNLTDGKIPASYVRRSGLDKRAASELVRVGYWHETDVGYEFHEWAERNPLKADVESRRESSARRTAESRRKRACNTVTDPLPTPPVTLTSRSDLGVSNPETRDRDLRSSSESESDARDLDPNDIPSPLLAELRDRWYEEYRTANEGRESGDVAPFTLTGATRWAWATRCGAYREVLEELARESGTSPAIIACLTSWAGYFADPDPTLVRAAYPMRMWADRASKYMPSLAELRRMR
jgi:hypothetical protein